MDPAPTTGSITWDAVANSSGGIRALGTSGDLKLVGKYTEVRYSVDLLICHYLLDENKKHVSGPMCSLGVFLKIGYRLYSGDHEGPARKDSRRRETLSGRRHITDFYFLPHEDGLLNQVETMWRADRTLQFTATVFPNESTPHIRIDYQIHQKPTQWAGKKHQQKISSVEENGWLEFYADGTTSMSPGRIGDQFKQSWESLVEQAEKQRTATTPRGNVATPREGDTTPRRRDTVSGRAPIPKGMASDRVDAHQEALKEKKARAEISYSVEIVVGESSKFDIDLESLRKAVDAEDKYLLPLIAEMQKVAEAAKVRVEAENRGEIDASDKYPLGQHYPDLTESGISSNHVLISNTDAKERGKPKLAVILPESEIAQHNKKIILGLPPGSSCGYLQFKSQTLLISLTEGSERNLLTGFAKLAYSRGLKGDPTHMGILKKVEENKLQLEQLDNLSSSEREIHSFVEHLGFAFGTSLLPASVSEAIHKSNGKEVVHAAAKLGLMKTKSSIEFILFHTEDFATATLLLNPNDHTDLGREIMNGPTENKTVGKITVKKMEDKHVKKRFTLNVEAETPLAAISAANEARKIQADPAYNFNVVEHHT